MASVSYHISSLLEKMTSTDKDFRCGPERLVSPGRAVPAARQPSPDAGLRPRAWCSQPCCWAAGLGAPSGQGERGCVFSLLMSVEKEKNL